MELMQMRVSIGNDFPVELFLLSDGNVVLVPRHGIFTVYDDAPEGVSGIFNEEGFSLKAKGVDEFDSYVYNVPYLLSNMPTLKAWLVQQNLVWPQ